MEHNLYDSKQKLIQVVNSYLKKLKKSSTLEELQQANEFLKETRNIAETLQFISTVGDDLEEIEECMVEQTDADTGLMNLVDFIAEGCSIIISLNNVKDHNKIEEDGLQWITDDTYRYLEEARALFGARIPVPPNLIGPTLD